MSVFSKKGALKAFWFLMAVDGEIAPEEIEQLNEIGLDLFGEEYESIRQELIDQCNSQIHNNIDADDVIYDLISEGVDEALQDRIGDPAEGVSPRLLVWNLLVLALSNDEYSKTERRLIKHIVRTNKIEPSVFMEMEQMIQTLNSIKKEISYLESSDRPYAEIRPIVEETEKRQSAIREAARALIEDEVIPMEEEHEDHLKAFLLEQKAKVEEKVNPLAAGAANQAGKLVGEVKEQSKNLFGNAKKLFKGKKEEE